MIGGFAKHIRIAIQTYQEFGFRIFLGLALKFFHNKYQLNIYAKDLTDPITKLSLDHPFYIKKGDLNYLREARQKIGKPTWELFCDIHDNAEDYFIVEAGNKIAHISWVYYSGDKDAVLSLKEREAEIKNCATIPEFRGNRLYPAVLSYIQEYLREKGYEKVFIRTNACNASSINGIKAAGFSFYAKAGIEILFGVVIKKEMTYDEGAKK